MMIEFRVSDASLSTPPLFHLCPHLSSVFDCIYTLESSVLFERARRREDPFGLEKVGRET